MSGFKEMTLPCTLSPEDTLTLAYMPHTNELSVEIMTDGKRVLTSVTLDSEGVRDLYAFLDEATLGSLADYAKITGE
jgi:hypothetical protein